MKLTPFTRGVLRLWVVLTVILVVYTYFKAVDSRQAWPRMWFNDTVEPAKLALSNPACQSVILNPERADQSNDKACGPLQRVLTTSESLKALTAKGVKITPQDIQADYEEHYGWYAVKGGLIEAGASLTASVVLLGIFFIVVKIGKWVVAGFRKETL